MITDTTFFTNEPGYELLDRFKKTPKHVKYFDVLVGYFRTSGFHQLFESFESIPVKTFRPRFISAVSKKVNWTLAELVKG
jgi:hypothetical protein